jgi:hypothetical protein
MTGNGGTPESRCVLMLLVLTSMSALGCNSHTKQPSDTREETLPPPIIDMHVHAYPIKPGWDANEYAKLWIPEGYEAPSSSESLMRGTLDELARHNVVKAWASGPVEVALSWKAAAPHVVFAAVEFWDEGLFPSVNDLRTRFVSGELNGLGEMGAQIAGLTPSDPFFEPYLALAEELDIPVGFHTGFPPPGHAYNGFPKNRARLGSPFGVEDALVRHPNLRPYIMHAGYPFLEETIAVLHAHPQLYVDISEIDWLIPQPEFHEYLRRLVESGFGKRLMYGSDQMWWPKAIGASIEAVESAPFLSEGQKRDIFYNNAARFLRLSDEEIARHHAK